MEYRVTLLKALVATGHVFEAHWNVTHVDGAYSAYRYGTVAVPDDPAPVVFSTVTEGDAIERVKDILGEEYIAAMEAGMVAEIAELQNPTVIQGLPWAPPPPAPAPAPAPPPP